MLLPKCLILLSYKHPTQKRSGNKKKSRLPKGGTTREARLEERQQRPKEVANLVHPLSFSSPAPPSFGSDEASPSTHLSSIDSQSHLYDGFTVKTFAILYAPCAFTFH